MATVTRIPTKPLNPFARHMIRSTGEWLAAEPPPREYLMTDLRTGRGALGTRGVTLLAAAGGAGKSFALIALAIALSSGTQWLSTFSPREPARVLFLSAEDDADELRRRIYHTARAVSVRSVLPIDSLDLHDAPTCLVDARSRITKTTTHLIEYVRDTGPYGLIVVDPLGRFAAAPIDVDNYAASALISSLNAVSGAGQGLVVATHHTSQRARREHDTEATAVRGATGLVDYARLTMVLGVEKLEHKDPELDDRLGRILTLRHSKGNYGQPWAPLLLRQGAHGVLTPLDAVDSSLVHSAREQTDPRRRRKAEQAAEKAERAQAEAARAEAKRAADVARAEANAAKSTAAQEAARKLILAHPGATNRALLPQLMAELRCARSLAQDALYVVRPSTSRKRPNRGVPEQATLPRSSSET